jgi:copper chaperone CopZ
MAAANTKEKKLKTKNVNMKKTFIVAFTFLSVVVNAQIKKITLQASGLTCSMCSNAINKSLKTLDFVDGVEANIKNSSFTLNIKLNTEASFDAIKNKVEDAGFFVATLFAIVSFNNATVENDAHVKVGKDVYHFLNIKNQELQGDYKITLLDKGFVTAKVFKKNIKLTSMNCYTTGKASSCCAKDGVVEGQRIYHVTI